MINARLLFTLINCFTAYIIALEQGLIEDVFAVKEMNDGRSKSLMSEMVIDGCLIFL